MLVTLAMASQEEFTSEGNDLMIGMILRGRRDEDSKDLQVVACSVEGLLESNK